MSTTQLEFAKEMSVRGLTDGGGASLPAPVPGQQEPVLTEAQELQNLKDIIVQWKQLEGEVSVLASQVSEKKKKLKLLDDMILRSMKKHNIGALDLKGSGGRLLYRRQTTKVSLNPKTISTLLTQHLKSETAATDALKYINEHRGSKVRESLLYERE
jgi:Family of unknown function (DUF5760)